MLSKNSVRSEGRMKLRSGMLKEMSRDEDLEIRVMQEESKQKAMGVRSVYERSRGEVVEMLVGC